MEIQADLFFIITFVLSDGIKLRHLQKGIHPFFTYLVSYITILLFY